MTEASTNTYGAILSPDAAVLAAASMAAAHANSSVATPADLASIAPTEVVPVELLTSGNADVLGLTPNHLIFGGTAGCGGLRLRRLRPVDLFAGTSVRQIDCHAERRMVFGSPSETQVLRLRLAEKTPPNYAQDDNV